MTKVVKLIAPGYYAKVFGKYIINCQRWLMKCNGRIFPHIQGYIVLHLEWKHQTSPLSSNCPHLALNGRFSGTLHHIIHFEILTFHHDMIIYSIYNIKIVLAKEHGYAKLYIHFFYQNSHFALNFDLFFKSQYVSLYNLNICYRYKGKKSRGSGRKHHIHTGRKGRSAKWKASFM